MSFKQSYTSFRENEMKLDVPVIGIVRGVDEEFFTDIMFASFEAGLSAIELTMNTENAARIVNKLAGRVPAGKLLGMGTIRNLNEAKAAADAGAMFFVTPNLDIEVVKFAVEKKISMIAGALTPTEVYKARAEGADMVKIFPSGLYGPQYFKDLNGPFDDIPLVAVGGVSIDNLKDYFKAGAKAVGVSSALFGSNALKNKKIDRISDNVKIFVRECINCNQQL